MAKAKLSLDQIRAAARPKVREVEIKSLGGTIDLRPFSGGELVAWQKEATARGEDPDLSFEFVARCWVGEDGRPAFSVAELKEFDGAVFTEVAQAASKVNGVTDEAIESAAKN